MPRPLTQERFRIMELYAELLHCSNMSILNRQHGEGPVYSSGGCLEGGLEALEKLGSALEGEREHAEDGKDEDEEIEGHVQKARELPVSSRPTSDHGDIADNDEIGNDGVNGGPTSSKPQTLSATVDNGPPAAPPPPSQADVARLRDVMVQHPRIGALGQAPSTAPDSEAAAAASNVAVASTAVPSVKDETMEDLVEQNEGVKQESIEQQVTGFADDDVLPVGGKLKQLLIRHHAMRSVVVSAADEVSCTLSQLRCPIGSLFRVPAAQLFTQRGV